ncbi:MAG TPA: hypothetical protein VHB21_05450 [Minicystis sp.]|nr:hypothetical protein [Minicystis sp.]
MTTGHTLGAPVARGWPQTALIGGRLWLWGGIAYAAQAYLADGGLLDFTTRTWTSLSITGAPQARALGAAVSTGDRVIVWGGETCDGPLGSGCLTSSGAVWDRATDTWTATSAVGAPSPRVNPAAVWTGSEMIVWGGANAHALADGAIYDPASDTWRPMSAVGAPSPRYAPIAIWTGSKMVVWGGSVMLYDHRHDGALYDPATDSWAPMPTETAALTGDADAPPYVWTGSKLVVFKYAVDSGPLAAAVYDPATNQFTAATAQGAPTGSQKAQIVVMGAAWDGQRVLLWNNVWAPPPGPASLEVWAYELPP